MHLSRTFALGGVIVGIIGLIMRGLSSDAPAEIFTAMNAANPAVPASIPTIWTGLSSTAQIIVVVLIALVAFLAFQGAREAAMSKMGSIITMLVGLGLGIYAIIKYIDTRETASTLEGAFGQAAAGDLIPAAFTVAAGVGFFIVIAGAILVEVGGYLGYKDN